MSGYEKKNTSSVLSHPYRVLVFSEGRISTTRTRISDCTCDLPYLCASHQPSSFNHIGRQKSDNATAKASEPESRARRDKRRSCSSRRNVIARRTSDKFRRRLLREALNPWIRAPTKFRSMTGGYIEPRNVLFHRPATGARKLQYESAARIARTFASFAAQTTAVSDKL